MLHRGEKPSLQIFQMPAKQLAFDGFSAPQTTCIPARRSHRFSDLKFGVVFGAKFSTSHARRVGCVNPAGIENASRPVSRVLSAANCRATIPLGRRLRAASSNPPGRPARRKAGACAPRRPYSVLLPVGFALPPLLPAARWALTPPFHPYPASASARRPCPPMRSPAASRAEPQAGRFIFCGTFPGVAPAGRYPAPFLRGARTFLPRRLSTFDGSGRPADWRATSVRHGRRSQARIRREYRSPRRRWSQAKGDAFRLVSSRCSVEIVDMSATPSTLACRK